jgi:hypothetical protein
MTTPVPKNTAAIAATIEASWQLKRTSSLYGLLLIILLYYEEEDVLFQPETARSTMVEGE